MEPNTYKYFNYNKKKCPLYNSNDYAIKLKDGMLVKIAPWEESLLLCYLNYSNSVDDSKRTINKYLNCQYDNFPFHNRDEFIDKFINDHPQIPSTDIENPLYSINGIYSFHVPQLDKTIIISAQEEKELADIVSIHKEKSQRKVSQWLLNYYYQKGVNPFTMTEEVKEIAISFIAERGYVVNRGINAEGVLTGVAVIWKVLLFIVAAPIFIWLVFSVFRVIFS